MTSSERDLVDGIRAELAAIDPARACDRAAERAALATATVARDPALARLWFRLARDAEVLPVTGPKPPGTAPTPRAAGTDVRDVDWSAAAEHCRLAWLRGLFLARGSLSLTAGRAHLEFVVEPDGAAVLAARLAELGLPAATRSRRGRGVVTWKSGETIGIFLRRIGANATLLELEARQVSRALRGEINRVINAESANLRRSVVAAGRQLDAIAALDADGRLAEQPVAVRRVAAGRRTTPEASLGELAEQLGLHRSRVQRALERLERLAFGDDGAGERRPRRPRRPGGTSDRRARGPAGLGAPAA